MTPSSSPRQKYSNRHVQILKDLGKADGRKAAGTEGCENSGGLMFLVEGQEVDQQSSLHSKEVPHSCQMSRLQDRDGCGGSRQAVDLGSSPPSKPHLQAISEKSLLSPMTHFRCFYFSPSACSSPLGNTFQEADLRL